MNDGDGILCSESFGCGLFSNVYRCQEILLWEMVLLEGQVHCPHFDKPKEFAEVIRKLIFRLGTMES